MWRRQLCVIIPGKNEQLTVGNCIRSVIDAWVSPEDIYVIDDGSSDWTSDRAKEHKVNVLRNDHSLGKSKSIARAIEHFELDKRYRLVALLDADTQVTPGYVRAVIRRFEDDADIALVCGQVRSVRCNGVTAVRALEYMISHAIYKAGQDSMGVILVAPGCTSVWRSSVLSKVDFSPDTLTEDLDITLQIHRQKLGKIVYAEDAIVYTQDPETVTGYARQTYRWDFGFWQVIKKHHLPFGFQRIDFEVGLLTIEGLIFSIFYLMTPLMFIWSFMHPTLVSDLASADGIGSVLSANGLLIGMLADQAIMFMIAVYFARKRNRWDMVKYFPMLFPLRLINCVLFLWTFLRVIVMRSRSVAWFSPARYSVGKH